MPQTWVESSNAREPHRLTDARVTIATGPALPSLHLPVESFVGGLAHQSIYQDLEWLIYQHDDRPDCLYAAILTNSNGLIVGYAPFRLQAKPIPCFLGEWKVLKFPLNTAFFFAPPCFPEDGAAYELLLSAVSSVNANTAALFVQGIPVDSFLWNYIHSDAITQHGFFPYTLSHPADHFLIELPSTYAEYLDKFSSKTRNTLSRKVRKLEEAASVKLTCTTTLEEVDQFVDAAVSISKKTYQYHLLGLGLRSADQLRSTFKFLAQRGWLRCYILHCNDVAAAFMICYQYGGVCNYIDVGYDPEWAGFSVGTVLQLKVIEHLLQNNTPTVFDFGPGSGEHKKLFANKSYLAADLYLLPSTPYAKIIRAVHRPIQRCLDKLVEGLDRLHVKRSLKQFLRRISTHRA